MPRNDADSAARGTCIRQQQARLKAVHAQVKEYCRSARLTGALAVPLLGALVLGGVLAAPYSVSSAQTVRSERSRAAAPASVITSLVTPSRIAVDQAGDVYVTDPGSDSVEKLSTAGKLLARWGGKRRSHQPGQFFNPLGIALDLQGNVYVVDSGNNRIQKFSPGGKLLLHWGSHGKGRGQLDQPFAIVVDRQGMIYVSDANNNRIQKFSPKGRSLAVWGRKGAAPGEFNGPSGLALDAAGKLYVADAINNRIQKFSPSGKVLAQWGGKGQAAGSFSLPFDVATDAAGNVYVADSLNLRIQKLSASDQPLAQWSTGKKYQPYSLGVDRQGHLYVSESGGILYNLRPRIVKVSATGKRLAIWLAAAGGH
jgi:tripartite motif-containing protein 71